MFCPECASENTITLNKDVIECDCGNVMDIMYNACESCGYTWRTKNGSFIDGCRVDDLDVIEAVDELLNSLFSLNERESFSDGSNMSEFLHSCIRCGELATETDKNNFICINCGFRWSVDDIIS